MAIMLNLGPIIQLDSLFQKSCLQDAHFSLDLETLSFDPDARELPELKYLLFGKETSYSWLIS
jgi:hypothetical protein